MTESTDTWPFMRQDPDRVVLAPRPGVEPSKKAPVRIFLGTEEAQYRAERVFFYSIEKVRDPSRTYEIHLMKNVLGFNRKSWRTGFTNYRFAIPDFAGGEGKAIYNDVDQIYLADPALLFDMDLGEHGYLAIHPKDTSVMLMDCARMLPYWNRADASVKGKKELTNRPLGVEGLFKLLDGHWNARDVEYVEGQTKCLHYTALHQQPWEPFPEEFSYHPNPLAYIWHDLEAEADAAGYQVFSPETPSAEFARRIQGSNAKATHTAMAPVVAELGISTALYVTSGGSAPAIEGVAVSVHDFREHGGGWPDGSYDLVLLDELFDNLPPVDAGWIFERAFCSASRLVWIGVHATASEDGLGSAVWWRQRIEDSARPHRHVSWQLDISAATRTAFHVRKLEASAMPTVWALAGTGRDEDVVNLADGLGWQHSVKRLTFKGKRSLPAFLQSPGLDNLTPESAAALQEPWPDLVVSGGPDGAAVARWIKEQSGGRTRLVQIGQPGAPFTIFDLILASPDDRLPIRPNVLQTSMPLCAPCENGEAAPGAAGDRRLSLLYLSQPGDGFVHTEDTLAMLARRTREIVEQEQGALTVVAEPGLGDALLARFGDKYDGRFELCDLRGQQGGLDPLFDAASRVIVTGDNIGRMAEAVVAGKAVAYMALPKWHDTKPVIRQLAKVLGLLTGGGRSYRGTPFQQHAVGRLVDHLATRGISLLPRDYTAYHQALRARGLIERLDDPSTVATPKPLTDLQMAIERVRQMMSQSVTQTS